MPCLSAGKYSYDRVSDPSRGRRQLRLQVGLLPPPTPAWGAFSARATAEGSPLQATTHVDIIMVMKIVTLADAKARLSALVDEVESGTTIAISRRHRVVAEVRPARSPRRTSPRPAGLCRGEFRLPDDFDAPLPAEVVTGFEGG